MGFVDKLFECIFRQICLDLTRSSCEKCNYIGSVLANLMKLINSVIARSHDMSPIRKHLLLSISVFKSRFQSLLWIFPITFQNLEYWAWKLQFASCLRPCYTVQFFLQLAMQFYSWEMLISEISEEFSICWENISGV
jgi:hypothetical protein